MAFGILYFENGIRVSVPYRGLIFLNIKIQVMCLPVSRFRPLPGTYISQSEGQSDTQNRDCFRPLPGTYISQLLHGTSKSGRKFVSVPYRGLIFLNKRKWRGL